MTTAPAPRRDLSRLYLHLHPLAQRVQLCNAVRNQNPAGLAANPDLLVTVVTTLSIWEELTGLSGPDALALAEQITSDPNPTVAAVVPF